MHPTTTELLILSDTPFHYSTNDAQSSRAKKEIYYSVIFKTISKHRNFP